MPKIILAARGRITTHFRENINRGFLHNGVDQGHGDGEVEDLRIVAPADGVVIAHGPLGSYGNRLVIRHADGWTSLLAHHAWQGVRTGDTVKQGDAIAVMGNTGTIFVHNHQELRDQNGNQVDPLLNLRTSSTATSNAAPLTLTPKDRTQDVETIRRTKTGDIFNIAPQFVKHLNTGGQATVSAAVQYENDKPHELSEGQFADLLDAYGIPKERVYGLGAGLSVGYIWSAEHEIRAALATLLAK